MKIMRKVTCGEVNEHARYIVGDQIKIGKYHTATCQKVSKKKAIFMMDEYLTLLHVMNEGEDAGNEYEASSLRTLLKGFSMSMNSMFDNIRNLMMPFENGDLLRIPIAEEIFCPEEFHKSCDALSVEKQWSLMKDRRNRIVFSGERQKNEWWWLQNKAKGTENLFSAVTSNGLIFELEEDIPAGVRVVFQLKSGN